MKICTYGWGPVFSIYWSFGHKLPLAWTRRHRAPAIQAYLKNRQNGSLELDAPARLFPEDGQYSDWIHQALPNDPLDCYRIRYDEGPEDRLWMETMDRNTLSRLAYEAKWDEFDTLRGSGWPEHLASFAERLEKDHRIALRDEQIHMSTPPAKQASWTPTKQRHLGLWTRRKAGPLDLIKKPLAAYMYELLAQNSNSEHDAYLVSRLRLANQWKIGLDQEDDRLRQSLFFQTVRKRITPDTSTPRLMPIQIETCTNLETAVINTGREHLPIMDYIKTYRRIPEHIFFRGSEIPLLGVMEMLAASRLLGDTDVLGRYGNHAGFVIERDAATATPVSARAVKSDMTNAFNFQGTDNRFIQSLNSHAHPSTCLADLKDIQYGTNHTVDIEWAQLTELQRHTFLTALHTGLETLNTPELLQKTITRHCIDSEIIIDQHIENFIQIWERSLQLQARPDVYGHAQPAPHPP